LIKKVAWKLILLRSIGRNNCLSYFLHCIRILGYVTRLYIEQDIKNSHVFIVICGMAVFARYDVFGCLHIWYLWKKTHSKDFNYLVIKYVTSQHRVHTVCNICTKYHLIYYYFLNMWSSNTSIFVGELEVFFPKKQWSSDSAMTSHLFTNCFCDEPYASLRGDTRISEKGLG